MSDLDEYRQSIDNLDAALVALLAERFRITRKVGLFKVKHSLPEKDEEREEYQFAKIEEISKKAGLRPETAHAVLRLVIDRVIEEHKEVRKEFFKNS